MTQSTVKNKANFDILFTFLISCFYFIFFFLDDRGCAARQDATLVSCIAHYQEIPKYKQ